MRTTRSCLCLIAVAVSISAQVLTTIAGTRRTFSSSTIAALAAPLGNVQGTAVDLNGNVYLSDTTNDLVMRVAPNGELTVVAGNGTERYSGDGGPATSAALNDPEGLAVDSSGNLYIADRFNYRIRKVAGGIITTIAGNGSNSFSGDGGPAVQASLGDPVDVKVDSTGRIYIVDHANNRIRMVSGAGIVTVAGNGSAGFSGDGGSAISASLSSPFGVALDATNTLFIADWGNNRVRKVSGGVITTVAGNGNFSFSGDGGPATAASLARPAGLAVDSGGNLYIADVSNFRIRKVAGGAISTVAGNGVAGFSGDGGPATTAALNYPGSLAVDSAGNLYFSDVYNDRVRAVAATGTIKTIAGAGLVEGDGGPATASWLGAPQSMAVGPDGTIYIADTNNNRIRRVSSGTITTIVGNGTAGYSGDGGPAVAASLSWPFYVALDSAGNLYFSDYQNNVVRKVSGGIITTVAGKHFGSGFSGDGGPATAASIQGPRGIAVDAQGRIYIADSGNDRVRMVSSGIITTVAGNGILGYSGDGGPATSASLQFPEEIALDSAGNLYIADINNGIRKVSGGNISTIAGIGEPPLMVVNVFRSSSM